MKIRVRKNPRTLIKTSVAACVLVLASQQRESKSKNQGESKVKKFNLSKNTRTTKRLAHKAALILLSAGCMSALLSPSAFAQTSAPAETNSDTDTGTLSLHVKPGTIQTRSFELDAASGAAFRSNGDRGAHLSLSWGKNIALGQKKTDWTSSMFVLGLKGEASFTTDETTLRPSKATQYHLSSPTLTVMEINFRFCTSRTQEGECIEYYENFDENTVHGTPPGSTFKVEFLTLGYLNEKDDALKASSAGLSMKFASLSGHKAFLINEVPVELCGIVGLVSVVAGETRIQGSKKDATFTPLELSGCAAVKLGDLRISDQAKFSAQLMADEYDPTKTKEENKRSQLAKRVHFSNSVHADFVSDRSTKAGLFYTYAYDQSKNADRTQESSIHSHLAGARVAF